ncbi:hypothetical protein SDC9_166912 [bioreactor metagenome]|uniref:Uncharacterized protein n=1 Tax=bioreactor metagenome TaxID=1076179 RepID=A0A645FYA9_9ZZZZ
MKNFLLRIKDVKVLCFLISIVLAILAAYLALWSDLLSVTGWLSWIFGLGALGILLLHVKSFFSTDVAELGFYYTRLYGLCFGFTCTSMVFLIILSFGEKSISTTSLFILMIAVFGIGFFNFFRDNYSDMAKKHLLAKELIEKNSKD